MFFDNPRILKGKAAPEALLFCFLWVLLLALYFPAAKAGFVADFTGWLDQVKNCSFSEFINRTHFQANSLYQFTQFNTWVFYQLFGANPWLWHLLFITLHTINATLLFSFSRRLLDDAGVNNSKTIATTGAMLFCLSPYISEVVVWEPSFHFLQGLLLILLILVCVQRYMHTYSNKYVLLAVIIYLISLFSLEIFYITPWLVLTLGLFYRFVPAAGHKSFRKAALYFFLPMLALFFLRFLCYRFFYGDWVSRIGSATVSIVAIESFGKPAKYIFHLLFIGRFLSQDTRQSVYAICDSLPGIVIFYGAVAGFFLIMARRCNTLTGKAKVALLFFAWFMIALLLLVPLWFQPDMLVVFDRYTYFAGAFFYMLFAVLVSFITLRYLYFGIISLFALVNLRFAIQVIRYWNKSYRIVNSLLHNIPDERNKIMLLLNLPQNMHGVPMIGAEKFGEYKLMHDLLIPDKPLTNTVYDVLGYNMLTPADGAHVNVINDSLIKVTLNQWGTWWWFETKGGFSYQTVDYKLDLRDAGHWYELTLKKPAGQYLLLYNVGDQWKVVDMSKKNVDQE